MSSIGPDTKSRSGKEVFIITSGQLINAKTAGAGRMLNIARSISNGGIKVSILSYADFLVSSGEVKVLMEGISAFNSGCHEISARRNNLRNFLQVSLRYMKSNTTEGVVYLYPTTFIFKDFIYLCYFKYLNGFRFFSDINELRSSIAFSSKPPDGSIAKFIYYFKSVWEYFIYSVNELQVGLYDGITVISVSLEKYFKRLARKSVRIPILCNTDNLPALSTVRPYNGDVFRICFAGYIHIEKEGFHILIESLRNVNRNRNVELYLYGQIGDEDRIRLKELTEHFGFTDHVFYKGNLSPELLQNEFSKYHLLVLPRTLNRRTKYGLSTKLADYLVSGTPVLVTDVSDNALIIKDNHNGFIVEPGSPEKMTDKILEIIDRYGSNAGNLVANAQRTAREMLDYKLYTRKFIDFFFNEPDADHEPGEKQG